MRKTQPRYAGGVLLEELEEGAKWIAATTGYRVELGLAYSVTEGGMFRVGLAFGRLVEGGKDGGPGETVHYFQWPASTDRFESIEALMMYILNTLGAALDYAQ